MFAGGLAWFGYALLSRGGNACVTGIVWQPDRATIDPHGDWQKLGADTLLIQWSVIDGETLVPVPGVPWFQPQPNWTRIAAEPWAKTVVLGLAGDFSEAAPGATSRRSPPFRPRSRRRSRRSPRRST